MYEHNLYNSFKFGEGGWQRGRRTTYEFNSMVSGILALVIWKWEVLGVGFRLDGEGVEGDVVLNHLQLLRNANA